METDSIIVGFLSFLFAELIEILIVHHLPEGLKQKTDQKPPQKIKVEHMKVKMPAFWEMSAADLRKIAEKHGLGKEFKLKADIIAELVELSR